MNTQFKNFLFAKFPAYFKRDDSNKDVDGKGTLERFLEIHGDELDEIIVPSIEEFLNILDAQIAPEEFLTHISDTLGNPPDITQNLDEYRNILSFIVSHYKIKGQEAAYILFFSLIGFEVTIEEIEPIEYLMDSGHLMDGEPIFDSSCPTCSCYTIEFTNIADSDNNIAPVTAQTIGYLREAIEFNEPINACLESFRQNIALQDDIPLCIGETIRVNNVDQYLMDNTLIMDNSLTMDDNNLGIIETINYESSLCPLPGASYNNDYNNDYDV